MKDTQWTGWIVASILAAILISVLIFAGHQFSKILKPDPQRGGLNLDKNGIGITPLKEAYQYRLDAPVTTEISPHGTTPSSPPLSLAKTLQDTYGSKYTPDTSKPAPLGWAQEQMQNEMERVHAVLPKKFAATPALPAFSPIKHTVSIPQVMATCTSAGNTQKLIWTNTLDTVAVTEGTAWLGVDMGAIEDVYVLAINLNSGDVWVVTNEDHYSDRTGGAASANIPFGGSPFPWLLNPNDQIELLIGCRGLANYHIGASLTFQYLSPAPTPVPVPAAQGK